MKTERHIKKNMKGYLEEFAIANLWKGRYNLSWQHIHHDVNILVGINGQGKTTLLNAIDDYYNEYPANYRIGIYSSVKGNSISMPVKFIQSFDRPGQTRTKSKSLLLEELEKLVLKNKESQSFFDYRMRALNYPEQAQEVNKRIDAFFKTVNKFFKDTHKSIVIDKELNSLAFQDNSGLLISLEMLSAGEKQLLYILLTVFLMDKKPFILLMDEPELSLHITWQSILIKELRKLNPSCQLIITTHSPSIFANGYEDKLIFMEDLIVENK